MTINNIKSIFFIPILCTIILALFIALPSTKPSQNTREATMTEQELHQLKIDMQFSPWDGSNYYLEQYIKSHIDYPDSYAHIQTQFIENQDHLLVTTSFFANNIYGIKIKNIITAKMSFEGDVLEIFVN